MGSKKDRTQKKMQRYVGRQNSAHSVQKSTDSGKKTERITSVDFPKAPIYTILIMIVGIVVLTLLFTTVMNGAVTQICIKNDPSLNNDASALKIAAEKYIADHPVFRIISLILMNFAGISAMFVLFGRLERCELPVIGFINNGKRKMDIGMGVIFALGCTLIIYNIFAFFGYVKPTMAFLFAPVQLLWALQIVIMCIFEEMFFRGYLLFKTKKYSFTIKIAVSALIFTIYKGLPSTMPSTYITYAIMGVFLAYTTLKFNTLWFSLSFRLVWTLVSGLVLSIYSPAVPGIVENSGIPVNLLAGSAAGFENGLIAGFVLILCFLLVKYMLKKRSEPNQRRLQSDGTIR